MACVRPVNAVALFKCIRACFRGYFGSRNRAGTADDQISLGKSLCHVPIKGVPPHDLSQRIGYTHRIIVAFAGLNERSRCDACSWQQVHGSHQRAVDDQRALTASGNQNVERLGGVCARARRKIPRAREFRKRRLASQSFVGASYAWRRRSPCRQHAIGESWLSVWLEHDGGYAAQDRSQHYRPGRVTPTPNAAANLCGEVSQRNPT